MPDTSAAWGTTKNIEYLDDELGLRGVTMYFGKMANALRAGENRVVIYGS